MWWKILYDRDMKWKLPPDIKIYEAMGAIADKRVSVVGSGASVDSSMGNKTYEVHWDSGEKAIMANDNGSYWQGYLGYPAIAFLILEGVIEADEKYFKALKGVLWQDINTQYRNDYEQTVKYVLRLARQRGFSTSEIESQVGNICLQIKKLNLDLLGKKVRPPAGN